MFDESTLVAVPPLHEDQHGIFSRPAAPCTQADVLNKLSNLIGEEFKFEVETTKVGYRILLANFSAQSRRKNAARLIQLAKDDLKDTLGLLLQYDKPHELCFLQRDAHKFLSVVQKRSKGAVRSKQLKGGFLVINGVRIAPEYLVPSHARWDELADAIIERVCTWKDNVPLSPETSILTDYFGYVFAANKGIFDLDGIMVDE
jgi:hypothetical protein